MTATELADALLAQRGCRDGDTPTRRRKALAALKAALDVEADCLEKRFLYERCSNAVVIAAAPNGNTDLARAIIRYADRLGDVAESLVEYTGCNSAGIRRSGTNLHRGNIRQTGWV